MSSVVGSTSEQSMRKRRANDLIYGSVAEDSESAPIAFFCECSSARCFETVWLTAAEYEDGDSRAAVLAPGH